MRNYLYNALIVIFVFSAMPSNGVAQTSINQPKCKSIEDCAQKAMEAAFEAKLALQIAVPIGAVMAFNLAECPLGWADIPLTSGRMVVGAGEGASLTPRIINQIGGVEKHTLSLQEMPSHNHSNENFKNLLQYTGNWTGKGYDGSKGEIDSAHFAEMRPAGGGLPHENMPPYIVLKYCERKI
ncbi:phage tail protein [Paracoccus sp. R86501]|uniref:phage tail protein n=1 Tax=Paracoccus sp. R86501 TaxID=3101711 RepID=UPI00366B682E